MVHGQGGTNFAHLLVGLLGADQVIEAEDHGQEVADGLAAYAHGGPEAGIQGRGDPCGAEVRAAVEVGEGLWAFEADELSEVAGNVQVEEGDQHGLPDSQLSGDEGGHAADQRRAVTVAPAR